MVFRVNQLSLPLCYPRFVGANNLFQNLLPIKTCGQRCLQNASHQPIPAQMYGYGRAYKIYKVSQCCLQNTSHRPIPLQSLLSSFRFTWPVNFTCPNARSGDLQKQSDPRRCNFMKTKVLSSGFVCSIPLLAPLQHTLHFLMKCSWILGLC